MIELEDCIEPILYLLDSYDWSENKEQKEEEVFMDIYDWLEDVYEIDLEYMEEIDDFILDVFDYFFNYFFQQDHSFLSYQINKLSQVYQPEQRTDEWYAFRNSLITASSCYKVFGSEKLQQQFIKEKTQPKKFSHVSVESPLHWGQKYEPLSVLFYEIKYHTKIKEFGCIRHEKYSFLGASPDGINVDMNSERYGRMLEIKNVVSREITGIPKNEYWIQMQIQMEVCNLDICDFLETKFFEYPDLSSFESDGDFLRSSSNEINKGVILQFGHPKNDFKPCYIYKPMEMDKEEFDLWYDKLYDQYIEEGYTWVRNVYWRLDIFHNTIVHRDKKWFQEHVQQIRLFWNRVEKELMSNFWDKI
jgi:putative phage-type endonuclease